MLTDLVQSLIRTYVPYGVGIALAFLARHLGIVIDESTSATLVALAAAVASGAYYTLVRLVERHYPAVGRVLLSLGLVRKEPVYVNSAAAYATRTARPRM
jgi:hypothetical protein